MNLALAFAICTAMYAVGTILNKVTHGKITTTLFTLIVFLIGFWTNILPVDLTEVAGISALYKVSSAVIITNVGCAIDLRSIKKYWKLALACIGGLVGLTIGVVGIGSLIFGREMALACYPTLTGGAQATRIISETLNEYGNTMFAGLIILLNTAQSWFGISMISWGVGTECKNLLPKFRSGEIKWSKSEEEKVAKKRPLANLIPAEYRNTWTILTMLFLISGISTTIGGITAQYTGNMVGSTIMNLLFGYIAKELGLLSSNPLRDAKLFEFFMFSSLMGLRANLKSVSFTAFLANIVPLLVLILLGGIGIFVVGQLVGKLFKLPKGIVTAATFGAYLGYPLNYQLAEEVIRSYAETPEEKAFLDQEILDKVFLGSLVSVTIISLIIANIVSGLLFVG